MRDREAGATEEELAISASLLEHAERRKTMSPRSERPMTPEAIASTLRVLRAQGRGGCGEPKPSPRANDLRDAHARQQNG